VKVENIPRVGFTTRRAAKNQGHLTVGDSLLGKVIKDDEDVLTLIHEILGKSTSRVRSEELAGGGIRSGSRDDNSVIESTSFLKNGNGAGDVRLLLADADVDAVDRLVILKKTFGSRFVLVGLGDHGVDRDGRLAGGTVTNNELTLSATDWNHSIDGCNSGLKRDGDRLTLNDARSNFLDRILSIGSDLTFSVDRLGKGIHDAAEEGFSNGNRKELTSRAALHPFGDVLSIAKEHDANFTFFKV
jgi:hypothetical protein